ncbi:MAG: excinuclease ABC subunit UvrC, partial [Actinomycetia bacterium]|nr:excinuclease ABC subunit UvrC [Actinomycetes bacterium]
MDTKTDSSTQQTLGEETAKPNIRNILPILPKQPGVYIFKDSRGRVIYVGKAQSLRDRVKSYFQKNDSVNYVNHPISFFTDKISSVDYIVTDNEVEALMLESNLIKKNRPKYNVSLKDDKSYPYIAITENEKFPRVFMTRNRNLKGAKYFGPYTNVKPVKEILGALRKIFQLRDCKKSKPGKVRDAVCLNYHINLCSAPCAGKITEEIYRRNIDYIKMFLKGSDKTIIENMKAEMIRHASNKEFEDAAILREKIEWINELHVNQKIFFSGEDTWEILSISKDVSAEMAAVSLFSYKEGELSAINNFIISNCKFIAENEILAGFLKSFYIDIDNVPSKIFIPFEIEDMELISEWLSKSKDKKIEIKVPKIGEKKKIIGMVARNAALYLEKKKFEKDIGYSKAYKDLFNLKGILGLENIPKRIECFDISNIGSSFAVGSMAVFI